MAKQLIVVVHGVGVREAGSATAQLSSVLTGAEGSASWQPLSTDDFLLTEESHYSTHSLASVFEAHQRRFIRRMRDDAGREVVHDRVIADYFWGDISGTRTSILGVLVGLVKIVLGLSHAVRENAMDVFPGDSTADRRLRWMARHAALLVHGPVVAINAVLLVGVTIVVARHWLNGRGLEQFPQPEQSPIATEFLLGVVVMGLAWILLVRAKVFLLRHLASWFFVTGGLVAGVALAKLWAPAMVDYLGALVLEHVFGLSQMARGPGFALAARGFATPAGLLMGLMVLAWTWSFVYAWIILFAGARRGGDTWRRLLVPQAIVLMSFLWMLVTTAIWALVLWAQDLISRETGFKLPLGLDPQMVLSCLRFATPAGLAFLALALTGLVLHFRKRVAFGPGFRPETYLPKRNDLGEKHRLIVGRWLISGLTCFLAFTTGLFIVIMVPGCIVLDDQACFDVSEINSDLLGVLLTSSLAAFALAAFFGRRGLAAGVAILTDVLVYLNDYSWQTREELLEAKVHNRNPVVPRTVLEKAFGLKREDLIGHQGFWKRERIHARMRVLMRCVVEDEDPDEIVIVSHSQGTVIALDVICHEAAGWRRREGGKRRLKLVTMGSPYTHLYNRYFPGAFPDTEERRALRQRKGSRQQLADWINIFRVDDFVGTHVDDHSELTVDDIGSGWPREYPVPRNGHTNYWVDENVAPILRDFLRFPS